MISHSNLYVLNNINKFNLSILFKLDNDWLFISSFSEPCINKQRFVLSKLLCFTINLFIINCFNCQINFSEFIWILIEVPSKHKIDILLLVFSWMILVYCLLVFI